MSSFSGERVRDIGNTILEQLPPPLTIPYPTRSSFGPTSRLSRETHRVAKEGFTPEPRPGLVAGFQRYANRLDRIGAAAGFLSGNVGGLLVLTASSEVGALLLLAGVVAFALSVKDAVARANRTVDRFNTHARRHFDEAVRRVQKERSTPQWKAQTEAGDRAYEAALREWQAAVAAREARRGKLGITVWRPLVQLFEELPPAEAAVAWASMPEVQRYVDLERDSLDETMRALVRAWANEAND